MREEFLHKKTVSKTKQFQKYFAIFCIMISRQINYGSSFSFSVTWLPTVILSKSQESELMHQFQYKWTGNIM